MTTAAAVAPAVTTDVLLRNMPPTAVVEQMMVAGVAMVKINIPMLLKSEKINIKMFFN